MLNEINSNNIYTDKANNKLLDNKLEEFIIDINDGKNNQNLLTNSNKVNNKLSSRNEISLNISPTIKQNSELNIICFSRRRKCPKKLEDLTGFIVTLCFFIIFTILMTFCLSAAKKISTTSESQKSTYNWIIIFIWITSILSIICLTDAASADPGRQRGTPIPKSKFDKNKIKKIVGGEKYLLKYCITCHLIRDVRTFHCNTCGICIEKHDHHCNYLSNCVGIYNYKKFFIFLIVACIHVSIVFITCIIYIMFSQGNDYRGYEWISFIITIIIIFGGFFEIFTVWMLLQNIVNIIQNRTTREFIKKKEYGIYNKGCRENCKEALCSSTNSSIRKL